MLLSRKPPPRPMHTCCRRLGAEASEQGKESVPNATRNVLWQWKGAGCFITHFCASKNQKKVMQSEYAALLQDAALVPFQVEQLSLSPLFSTPPSSLRSTRPTRPDPGEQE